jgi:signal transduction histidine kinase
LLELQDRDLQFVAHEIHDGPAQQLVAAIMHLRTFIRLAK